MPDLYINQRPEGVSLPPRAVKTTIENRFPPTKNSLTSLAVVPKDIFFETQDKDEKIILLLRKHPITSFPPFVGILFLFLAPCVFFNSSLFSTIFGAPVSSSFLTIGILTWFSLCFLFAFINFLIWYFDVCIVTNKRVVDIDLHGLFYKEVTDASLTKIQDVTVHQTGLLSSVFNFGDVFIQTASAESQKIDFIAIPQPTLVADAINDLTRAERQDGLGR